MTCFEIESSFYPLCAFQLYFHSAHHSSFFPLTDDYSHNSSQILMSDCMKMPPRVWGVRKGLSSFKEEKSVNIELTGGRMAGWRGISEPLAVGVFLPLPPFFPPLLPSLLFCWLGFYFGSSWAVKVIFPLLRKKTNKSCNNRTKCSICFSCIEGRAVSWLCRRPLEGKSSGKKRS